MNSWKFSGECFKITPFNYAKDFSGAISVRGASQRTDNVSAQVIELSAYVNKDLWDGFVSKMKPYRNIEIDGHLEMWANETSSGNVKTKIVFVADAIEYCEAK